MKEPLSRLAVFNNSEAIGSSGEPPAEISLFKYGSTPFIKNGVEDFYTFSEADADNLIAEHSRKGVEIPFDYDHAMLKAPEKGNPAPAAGFISELVKKTDGLYAKISYWTQKAKDFILSGEYRYISPTFKVSRSKRNVTSLYNVALTNKPATLNAPVLMMADGLFSADDCSDQSDISNDKGEHDVMLKLCEKIGLEELIDLQDDEQIENALAEAIGELKEHKTAADEFLAAHDCVSFEQLDEKMSTLVPLEEKLALAEELKRKDANACVERLVSEGKITFAQKDQALNFALNDLAGFEDFYANAPVITPDNRDLENVEAGEQVPALSDSEREIFRRLNLTVAS